MSILRSGEIFSNREGGGWGFFRDGLREAGWERCDEPATGCEARERPLRPAEGLDFLREGDFERVIGMAKSLYCFLLVMKKPDRSFYAVHVLLPACNDEA
jgi:hypothetical protein